MRLDKLLIRQEYSEIPTDEKSSIEIDFGDNNRCLVYSPENTVGKTTLIRLLLCSMGFAVPSTFNLDFSKLETELWYSTGTEKYCIIKGQEGFRIKNSEGEDVHSYSLEDGASLIAFIFNIESPAVVANLLGCFYFDQHSSWNSSPSKGNILGSNRFNIDDLAAALLGVDLTDLERRERLLQDQKTRISILKEASTIFDNFSGRQLDLVNEQVKFLQGQKSSLLFSSSGLREQILSIEQALSDMDHFKSFIENSSLEIRHGSYQPFLLKASDITPLGPYYDALKAQKMVLRQQLAECKESIAKIDDELADLPSLDITLQAEPLFAAIKNSPVSPQDIVRLEKDASKNEIEISKEKNKLVFESPKSTIFQKLIDKIADNYRFLGVRENKVFDDPLHASSRLSITGAEHSKIVFGYRVAVNVFLRTVIGIDLPLIIDSPGSNESDEKTQKSFELLMKREVPNSQIIVSSIYPKAYSEYSSIEITGGLFWKSVYHFE
jgi:hypothetical protein